MTGSLSIILYCNIILRKAARATSHYCYNIIILFAMLDIPSAVWYSIPT